MAEGEVCNACSSSMVSGSESFSAQAVALFWVAGQLVDGGFDAVVRGAVVVASTGAGDDADCDASGVQWVVLDTPGGGAAGLERVGA